MKYFLYDLETTGLDSKKNAIHQLSGKVIINGVVKETFDIHMQPFAGAEISDEALRIGNVTRGQIASYQPQREAYKQVMAILSKYVNKFDKTDKMYLVGFNNVRFDNDFFRAFFERNGNHYFGSYFWSDSMDCMIFASALLAPKRSQMPNFKQSTVAQYLGVTVAEDKLHNANYDIELCQAIFEKCIKAFGLSL